MQIIITPKRLLNYILIIILCLLLMNFIYIFTKYLTSYQLVAEYLRIFNFDREASIPTLYSCMALFLCSFLLFVISTRHSKILYKMLMWRGLALLFLFLTIDEMVSFHESLILPFRSLFDISSGFLFFAWVIPYGIGVFVFGLVYLRFLMDLPKKTRFLFILSGSLFVSGAIGMELIGANEFAKAGYSFSFSLITTLEESMEMIGIAFFIYALAQYIYENFGSFSLKIVKAQK